MYHQFEHSEFKYSFFSDESYIDQYIHLQNAIVPKNRKRKYKDKKEMSPEEKYTKIMICLGKTKTVPEEKAWRSILKLLYKKGLFKTFLKFERVINYLYQLLDDMNTPRFNPNNDSGDDSEEKAIEKKRKETKFLQTSLDAFEEVAKKEMWHPYTPANRYWPREQTLITFPVWDILSESWKNKDRGSSPLMAALSTKERGCNDADTYAKKNPFKTKANHPNIYTMKPRVLPPGFKPSKKNVGHGFFSKINNGLS